MVLVVKSLPANAGDVRDAGSIPGSGRSPGVVSGNPLQYAAWKMTWTVQPGGPRSMGVTKSRTQLSTICVIVSIGQKREKD